MSAESALWLEIQAMRAELRQIVARLDASSPSPWPDRLTTSQAVVYIRQAHGRPRFNARTLWRWLQEESLSDIAHPRRWLRSELGLCCGGTPVAGGERGR